MADDLTARPEPPVIDRAGLERVLARATELQAAVGDRPEALSEQQLIELGSEVGISPEHLRQAIAEERGRGLLPPEPGISVALAGVSSVAAARVVPGTPAGVLAALDATMQRDEVLVLKRRFPERLMWEAQRGFIGGLGRALSGRSHHLANATDVTASVAAVDATRVHVRLLANFADERGRRLAVASGLSIAMLLTGVPLLVMGFAPAAAIVPPLVFGGSTWVVTRRQYRRMLARAHVALEQVLDRLEYGAAKPTAAQSLLDAIVGPPRLPR